MPAGGACWRLGFGEGAGSGGKDLFKAFSSALVLAWKEGPDWVYPCSIRILNLRWLVSRAGVATPLEVLDMGVVDMFAFCARERVGSDVVEGLK